MPSAEDSMLASKILAGTRGGAGALTEQVLSKRILPQNTCCLAAGGPGNLECFGKAVQGAGRPALGSRHPLVVAAVSRGR